ncbi:MAG: hypothetical protein K2H09_07920 [Treponemataceae bacterium]|nr:hypothetical protein [Treponemataceae bacterium]
MWLRIKRYGWPQGRGYLAEPEAVRMIVQLFDREQEAFRQWEKRHGR